MTAFPADLRIIRQLTGKAERPIYDVMTAAWARTRAGVDLAAVADALARGNLDAIEHYLHVETMAGAVQVPLNSLIYKTIANAGAISADTFAASVGLEAGVLDMDLFRLAAVDSASEQVGNLVTAITDSARESIRETVAAGFREGWSQIDIARNLRDVVGLDARRAESFNKFLARLKADPPDLSSAGIQRLIDAEYGRLLKSRTLTIARTESVRASTLAQQDLFETAVDQGEIESDAWEQEWIASPNACDECNDLDGETTEIGGEFPDPGGSGPPDPHPACQCALRLIRA